ncbi:MAG: amino acid carrier protein [Eubacteriales bacterium]|nr:amino acid carrier protein [Eubacteriales bacterium]
MTKLLSELHSLVWGVPALVLILGVGLWLTAGLGLVQLRLFPRAMRRFLAQLRPARGGEGVTGFQALCTALAATVGTGNLVGVAGALCLGGPGAIFWMWLCGILGMATKFAEATLALRYRVRTPEGFAGGPMYTIARGLGRKWLPLAKAYCVFGIIAAFGVGNATQVSAVASGVGGVLSAFGAAPGRGFYLALGVVLAAFLGNLLRGGAGAIGSAAEKLVPFAAAGYILLCLYALWAGRAALPAALAAIFRGAFDPRAVTGGMLGSAVEALRIGCSRGVFTNEAGMGTASIAHAAASVDRPAQQGLLGMVEVFLDTIVICTLTALVILVSGVPIPYGRDVGGQLTTAAFARFYGAGAPVLLTAFLVCFAVATVLGWGLYGSACARFLLGSAWAGAFVWVQMGVVVVSCVADTASVWQLSETVNGLMAIPNLISLALLLPELRRLTKEIGE